MKQDRKQLFSGNCSVGLVENMETDQLKPQLWETANLIWGGRKHFTHHSKVHPDFLSL
jgi:hypothetical protein